MATPSVLAFDAEGRAIDFEVWVDDLQLFLQCDRADGLSLFDLTSGASPAPAADADPTVRSQWATRDAAARLAVRRHLPTSELRDHFLTVCPTTLTVDSLEKALLAAEKSIVAVGASRGDPRAPILRGVLLPLSCPLSPLPLRPTSLVLSRSVRRLPLAGDAALARARGARERVGLAGAVAVEVEAAEGVGVEVEEVAGVGVLVVAVEAEASSAAAVLAGVAAMAEVEEVEVEVVEVVGVALHIGAALGVVSASSSSSSSSVLATSPPLSSSVSGTRSVSVVGVLVPAPTSFAPATARVSSVGVPTPPSAVLAA
ncbi:unnamed protein product [Closterium sp. NIES-64]|nr:unnamed protein product [Closterium sp. NIES-64]